MPVPIVYRRSAEGIIPTYNFTDVAQGVGILTVYLTDVETPSYVLSNQLIYAQVGFEGGAENDNIDRDWDLEIGQTLTMKGEALFNMPVGFHTSGVGTSHDKTFTFTLYHYDGTTETQLAQDAYRFNEVLADGSYKSVMIAIRFSDIDKVFKPGDIVRLNITTTDGSGANPSHRLWRIGYDPKARTDLFTGQSDYLSWTSQSIIYLPIKINL